MKEKFRGLDDAIDVLRKNNKLVIAVSNYVKE